MKPTFALIFLAILNGSCSIMCRCVAFKNWMLFMFCFLLAVQVAIFFDFWLKAMFPGKLPFCHEWKLFFLPKYSFKYHSVKWYTTFKDDKIKIHSVLLYHHIWYPLDNITSKITLYIRKMHLKSDTFSSFNIHKRFRHYTSSTLYFMEFNMFVPHKVTKNLTHTQDALTKMWSPVIKTYIFYVPTINFFIWVIYLEWNLKHFWR